MPFRFTSLYKYSQSRYFGGKGCNIDGNGTLDYGKDWCWSWNSSTLVTSCEELTHWKRPWCWEGLGAGGEGGDRGWDGLMASLTRWTWVWASSGRWWWTGRPGMLDSWGCKESDMTEWLNWTELKLDSKCYRNTEPAKMTFKLKDLRKCRGKNWHWHRIESLLAVGLLNFLLIPKVTCAIKLSSCFIVIRKNKSLTPCCMCFFYLTFLSLLFLSTKMILSIHNCLPWRTLPSA